MELIKITALTEQLGVSARSLRYYEQSGLLQSVRPEFEKYRFYDAENVERLKQILVLRKMQIPIKDILRIYEDESMSTVVEVFVERIHALEAQEGALAELKRIVSEFLQTMLQNGITKISALPLLYEELEKLPELPQEREPLPLDALSAVSEQLEQMPDPAIVSLPILHVATSFLRENPQQSDVEGFWRRMQAQQLPFGQPGRHERFEFQTQAGEAAMLRVPEAWADGEFLTQTFPGGLFAAVNVYLDEDLGQRFRALLRSFDGNQYYEVDYTHGGALRHPALLENLISPDERRELVCLLVPVKKRRANPALFDAPREVAPGDITPAELEAQNPVLWTVDVPMAALTPVNNPQLHILESGEAEYRAWLLRQALDTHTAVTLPFRVDMEFRVQEESGRDEAESSIFFSYGADTGYNTGSAIGVGGFGVNTGNSATQREEGISFHQPIFRDCFNFPGRGRFSAGETQRVSWIVGSRYLAVRINDEIRYCGSDFPYMSVDWQGETPQTILIGAHAPLGADGKETITFRAVRISQLARTQKNRIKEGALTMVTKQSNNIIPVIHRLITDEKGENYWFNGCASYVMECLGEADFDYQFFAGLTGDVFVQHYSHIPYGGDGVSAYRIDAEDHAFFESIFTKCGYASTVVPMEELQKNLQMYLPTLCAYIDRGIPVITNRNKQAMGVFVGYEEYGKTLLYMTANNNEPLRIAAEEAIAGEEGRGGWIFVGDKKENRPLAEIYREALCALPALLGEKGETYAFGAQAFRAWADDVENGRFDGMKKKEFNPWPMYTNFVCVLATNGSCCHDFLERASQLNPEMKFLEEISELYRRTANIWNNDDGEDLEALGGGFNVTVKVLQNKKKRAKIAEKLREAAGCIDRVAAIFGERFGAPNAETVAALQEAENILHDPTVKRYSDVEEALRELEE